MKKKFLNFAEQILSKDQMKKVKGACGQQCHLEVDQGYGGCGTSTVYDVEGVSAANLVLQNSSNVTGWRYWCA